MPEVAEIKIKKVKGVPAESVIEAILEEGWGLSGDIHGGKGERQVSLMEAEGRIEAARSNIDGFCTKRFSENILTRGISMPDLSGSAKLKIGEALMEITQTGKECLSDCPAYDGRGSCGLWERAAFARVLKSGKIKVGDKIEVL